ncbi:cytochrome P450 2U1-like [Dreissena polymorpha]|uniref:Cytochrome P450 n=1 Tax=Dreissena polymorpha TaxID=45954 RepID=A0A9D4II43_DREPO|nr:cytochrome P450 2U1-like [Dreissena polymorpha]XP_052231353.1 cytochrome P450 2U1-like [Dreissena polymorpha]KAH3773959.1 hypothetical protein DPMN_175330 [Dreissena polymorpha]
MLTFIIGAIAVVLLLTHLYSACAKNHRQYGDIPAVDGRLPIVGNIFDLSKTHIVLTDWYRKYGSVFRFNLFGEEVVVLSSYESVFEALVTRGSDFAGRPHMSRTDYEGRNRNSIVWQSYTPKLQFLRKQIHSSLRMYGSGLGRLQHRCGFELEQLLDRIESQPDLTFDPWSLLYDSACNIMLDLTIGTRFPYEGEDLSQLKKINGLFNHSFGPGVSRILDRFPFLNCIRDEFKSLKTAVDMRNSFWADHIGNLQRPSTQDECVIQSLRDLAAKSSNSHFDISEATLKETFTNLILAGTDTTTTAITCLLLVLLHKPEIQDRMYQELDHVVGRSRAPSLSDRSSMPYTEACLFETLRLISHVPLAVPHATICDTTVLGKRIPKDTTVYINLWSLHHDPEVWHDPWEFDPGRFLDADGHLLPPHHECRRRLLVFGAGRRVCLGESLAKNRLFLFTTALLQRYDFRPASSLPDLDPRKFSLGIVLHPGHFNIKAIKRTNVDTTISGCGS